MKDPVEVKSTVPVAGVEQLTVNEEDDKLVVVIEVDGAPQVPESVTSSILNSVPSVVLNLIVVTLFGIAELDETSAHIAVPVPVGNNGHEIVVKGPAVPVVLYSTINVDPLLAVVAFLTPNDNTRLLQVEAEIPSIMKFSFVEFNIVFQVPDAPA